MSIQKYIQLTDKVKIINPCFDCDVTHHHGDLINFDFPNHNLTFQKRIVDIKNLKKIYPNIKIVLTGRKAIYRESEIIQSLFLYEGMNRDDLIIIRVDPYNTFENIVSINNFLVKNKISDIIFLTSPYHTLRSKLIWKKNFPEVKVIIPKMTDTPKSKLIWGLSYEKIKIIIYEYLAIIYNKSKGWI